MDESKIDEGLYRCVACHKLIYVHYFCDSSRESGRACAAARVLRVAVTHPNAQAQLRGCARVCVTLASRCLLHRLTL